MRAWDQAAWEVALGERGGRYGKAGPRVRPVSDCAKRKGARPTQAKYAHGGRSCRAVRDARASWLERSKPCTGKGQSRPKARSGRVACTLGWARS